LRKQNIPMKTSTAEIKNYLHKLIVETDDENILSKVQAYFNTLKGKNIDWWDMISKQEKDAINTGLRQLENGEGIPHEEVRKKADKILAPRLPWSIKSKTI